MTFPSSCSQTVPFLTQLAWQGISVSNLYLSNRFQNQVIANQLKRQSDDLLRLRASLDTKTESENRLEKQVRESKRQYADLESRMKEEIMMARIRDAENTQRVAELTQKISGLECKVRCVKIFLDLYRMVQ